METKTKKKKETFGDQFDFANLFRAKGKQGVYYPVSQINKGGLIGVTKFLEPESKAITVKANDLVCLGRQVFFNKKGQMTDMADVFTNLNKYVKKTKDAEFKNPVEDIMEKMVPDYDELRFKDYHAKQVFKWYIEIIGKTKENEK